MKLTEKTNTPEQVGRELRESILRVFQGVPNCELRPSNLSRVLSISRVMISRVLSSIAKENPIETLTGIPGPETLRSIIQAAKKTGVSKEDVQAALIAVDQFDHMIRVHYGTRGALSAALSVESEETLDKFEHSSRFQIFKGMSQVLGVQSKAWLTCSLYTPNADDGMFYDLSSIYGPSGLRRLRPDSPTQIAIGTGPKQFAGSVNPHRRELDLSPYCSYPAAPTSAVEENGKIIHTFANDIGDKDSFYDMIKGVHISKATPKVTKAAMTRRGISVIPIVPTVTLNMDILLHGDIFHDTEPEVFVYNTRGTGKASFENPNWELNRMVTHDKAVKLGRGLEGLEMNEVPGYSDMVAHLCAQCGYAVDEFYGYRLQIQYPIFGFQYAMTFAVPDHRVD